MASVMPVSATMSGGMTRPGLTRLANSAQIRPPLSRTAPISVIPSASGDQPVVSTSTTTKSSVPSGRRRIPRVRGWRRRVLAAASPSRHQSRTGLSSMITLSRYAWLPTLPAQARRRHSRPAQASEAR